MVFQSVEMVFSDQKQDYFLSYSVGFSGLYGSASFVILFLFLIVEKAFQTKCFEFGLMNVCLVCVYYQLCSKKMKLYQQQQMPKFTNFFSLTSSTRMCFCYFHCLAATYHAAFLSPSTQNSLSHVNPTTSRKYKIPNLIKSGQERADFARI